MDLTHAKLQFERGSIDEAAGAFMQALSEDFNDAEALFWLASCFLKKGQYGAAANFYKACLEITKLPEAIQNLGACYKSVNKMDLAEQVWDIGIPLAKNDRMRAQFHSNIAGCYVNNGTPGKALEHYKKAVALDPTNTSMQFNMCWPYLESGDWLEGLKRYDMGFKSGDRAYRTYEGVKPYQFTGYQEIHDKTVIVWGDQGIGDEIMFASCIPDLMKDAKRVIFDCHPRLVRLFEQSFGIECHGTRKTQQMDWHLTSGADVSIPLSSLATIYRSTRQFPQKPYLSVNTMGGNVYYRPRIGISWAGGTQQTRHDLRSISLHDLLPIFSSDVDWYSLQYTDGAAQEVARFEEESGIHIKHYPGHVQCDDYCTTAEFVSTLDLVITVCTSVVHLAGALGVPCWCLTPSKPAWRYGCVGPVMPWYSAVRLFRQKDDDWASTIKDVAYSLEGFLQKEVA